MYLVCSIYISVCGRGGDGELGGRGGGGGGRELGGGCGGRRIYI